MLSKLIMLSCYKKVRIKKQNNFVSMALAIGLLVTLFQVISSPISMATIPESARLIGDNRGTIKTITNPNSVNNGSRCMVGTRGIATDGTHVYFRPGANAQNVSQDVAPGLICKATMNGVLVEVRSVTSSAPTLFSLGIEQLDLTYSSGCIFVRTPSDRTSVNCIDTSDWTFNKRILPEDKQFYVGGSWLFGNLIDFPDGRIGAVSAPNQTLTVGTGKDQCPSPNPTFGY